MTIQVKSLFVSSTSDLSEEREAVQDIIRKYRAERQILPYISDFDVRPGETPEDRLCEEIRNTDLFMMILGGRHGSPYPRAMKEPPPSICEWEFKEAHKRKRYLQMVAMEKVLPSEAVEEPQRRFRERVREFCSGEWRMTFSDQEEFCSLLISVLMVNNLAEKKSLNFRELFSRIVLVLALVLLPALWWLDDKVSRPFAAGALSTAAALFLGFSGHNLIGMFRR
jgi:hypothetical protein